MGDKVAKIEQSLCAEAADSGAPGEHSALALNVSTRMTHAR